jgi:outer membrane protein OmpA-like peptidoglycan-associated protein
VRHIGVACPCPPGVAKGMQSSTSSSTSTKTTVRVRRFRRVSPPVWPFFPRGLLPLLGLLLLAGYGCTRFAKREVEANVDARVGTALAGRGFGHLQVAVDGQQVHLTGTEKVAGEGAVAIALAKEATCDTWTGPRVCAISVDGKFNAPTATGPWPDHNYGLEGGVLTLRGEVADAATKAAIVTEAQKLIGPSITVVRDEMAIAGRPIRIGHRAVLLRSLESVSRCVKGMAQMVNEEWSLRCEVTADVEGPLRASATAPWPAPAKLGKVQLLVAAVADACDRDFAALLTKSTLEFATGKAELRNSSKPILDQVAAIAARCPGTLHIDGHTDNRGSAELNKGLSQARADAVKAALVQRTVDANRLIAKGYGPDKPKADNNNDAGRALNRRIEIFIDR